jgi:predicted kinase
MPTAHLIHGFLGVGKTTLARQLEQKIRAIRFSHDEWMTRLYGDDPPAESFPELCRRVSELLDQVWPRCLELDVDVVLDFGFWARPERDAFRAKIAAVGAQARLYRVTCSEAEAWRRIEKRNTDLQGSLYIARNTFEILRHRFEPLDSDEECIEIVG